MSSNEALLFGYTWSKDFVLAMFDGVCLAQVSNLSASNICNDVSFTSL